MNAKSETLSVEPYLMFNGRCQEALDFYAKAIDAEIQCAMRFKDSPEPPPSGTLPPGFENKIMHATFRVGKTTIMASDGCEAGPAKFAGFSLALAVFSEEEADRYFSALAAGGKVTMPLAKTFWSPKFGMVEDKFGISWMVNVLAPEERK